MALHRDASDDLQAQWPRSPEACARAHGAAVSCARDMRFSRRRNAPRPAPVPNQARVAQVR